MNKSVILIISITVFLSVLILYIKKNDAFDELFIKINLIEAGKYYPANEKDLIKCKNNGSEECKVYDITKRAKKKFLSFRRSTSLNKALQVIKENCPKLVNSNADVRTECIFWGACISFYFFTNPNEDKKILKFFRENPSCLEYIIKNNDFAWFSNRPDSNKWNELINELNRYRKDKIRNPFIEKSKKKYRVELLD